MPTLRRDRPRQGRQGAERLGRWAEWLCRLALRLKGYRILGTRIRTAAGEVDILAVRGDVLAVVEVKARATETLARLAARPAGWRRTARAAAGWRSARPQFDRHTVRYDLMIVTPGRWPRHLPDAWRREGP